MPHKIRCYTLFDITSTGIPNRSKPPVDVDSKSWIKNRNTQSNFDTILQVISLRSQPEIISLPVKSKIKFNDFTNFGFLYQQVENETYPMWSFDFEVQHSNVFYSDEQDLKALYNDCNGVPMIKVNTEWNKLPNFLDVSPEFRNIYFKLQ